MSCDGEHAKEVFVRAIAEEVKAIIMYTDVGNCCVFEPNSWKTLGPHQPMLFTFANMKAVDPSGISAYESASSGVDVVVEYWAHLDAHVFPYRDQTPDNHAAPKSPTKLMVYILVSAIATGFVIIMLFLGLRAYKRMEEDPIQHIGSRPRQSRARGIARAALDAIPIIRFRTRPQEALEKDLEMQDGASSLGPEVLTTGFRSDSCKPEGTRTLGPVQIDETAADLTTTNTLTGHPLLHSASSSSSEAPIPNSPNRSQTRCPVCFDDFEEDQAVRVLPCDHSFHIDCIDPWLLNVAGSCPLCRIDLSSPEGHEQDPPTNILTPPPAAVIPRSRNSSRMSGRLQSMIEAARGPSALEERLAAVRAVRDEGGNGNRQGPARSKRLELRISRLGRAMLGSGSREDSRSPENREGLTEEAGTASGLEPSPPLSERPR